MINLKDKLAHLNYQESCRLLGAEGEQLIRKGGKYEINLDEQVALTKDLFSLNLPEATVTIRLDPGKVS
ncbi:MAG: hypothetical protein U1C55_02860 [Smithellaceae bacterium]|nr:hypothetical protein [Smithellaceae bacterium]